MLFTIFGPLWKQYAHSNTCAVVPVPDFLLVPNVNTVGFSNILEGALNSSTQSQIPSGINTATAGGVVAATSAHDDSS